MVDPPHAWYKYEDPKEYVKAVEEYLRKRLELYSDLMETLEWDFFFTIFSEIDWVLHKIPSVLRGNSNLIGNILYLIKRFVKRAIMHSDFLLIVSDHGFEEKYIELNINSVLR
ncbi:phosphodiesterase, partial [archaeon]